MPAYSALRWMAPEARWSGLRLRPVNKPLGPRILHQQRIASRLVGKMLSQLQGEEVRREPATTNQTMIASMDMSRTASAHLGPSPIPCSRISLQKISRMRLLSLKVADNDAQNSFARFKRQAASSDRDYVTNQAIRGN
jgi:hypothetical protein